MNEKQLMKKVGKLLGKKEPAAATIEPPDIGQPKQVPLDKLGVIHLHPYWRN